MSVFDESLDSLLARCRQYQDIPCKEIQDIAATIVRASDSAAHPAMLSLEEKWYESLRTGQPLYAVYSDPLYVAEAWGCWAIYSRKYLRNFQGDNSLRPGVSILHSLRDATSVVDLGCGYGHTAAAWRELLPDAEVIGTNVPGTLQMTVARQMGEQYGFSMSDTLPRVSASVVFASEYFEHIEAPLAHLSEIVRAMQPRVMLVANAFGQRAIGHFVQYRVGSKWIHGKHMSRVFGIAMKRLGYRRVKTKLWNQRPALWMRTE